MKSRSKKFRQSRWFRKQSAQKEVFKAPVFENLEERQLMSGSMYVGTNLDSIVTSSTNDVWRYDVNGHRGISYDSIPANSTPFTDIMKNADWRTKTAGSATRLTIPSGSGQYTVTGSGHGVIRFGSQTFTFNGNNQTAGAINVQRNDRHWINVKIESGTIDQVSVVKNGDTGAFSSEFKNLVAPFSGLRFMDWGHTNNSELETWNQRVKTAGYQGTNHDGAGNDRRTSGVAFENMIALANETGQNPWLTLPAKVNNDYVTRMANYIKNNLNANLKVFVEYGNETWNTQFTALNYFVEQAEAKTAQGLDWGTGLDAGHRWASHRSAAIWKIFADVFDGYGANPGQSTNRLIKVIGSQSNAISVSTKRIAAFKDVKYNPHQIMPDALAIAPYFTKSDLVKRHVTGTTTANARMTTAFQNLGSTAARKNRILNDIANEMESHLNHGIDNHKAVANANNLWLVAYEGGQHVTADAAVYVHSDGTRVNLHAEDIPELIDALVAVNRDPQMYNLYTTYLNTLQEKGISLYQNFTSTYAPSKWGMWGLKENQAQPTSQAHKYRAVENWINAHSANSINLAPIARAGGGTNNKITTGEIIATAGSNGQATVKFNGTASSDLDGTINASNGYQWKLNNQVVSNQAIFNRTLAVGNYTFVLKVTDNQGKTDTSQVIVNVAPQGATGTLAQSNFTGSSANFQNNGDIDSVAITPGSWVQRKANNNGIIFRTTHDPNAPAKTTFNANQYLAFKVTPKTNKTADYRGAKFKFTINRSSFHSQRGFALKSSVDGFSQFIGGPTDSFTEFDSVNTKDIEFTIPASAAYRTGNQVEFRLYFYGSSYGHDTNLKAVTIHGSTGGGGTTNHAPVARANNVSRTGAGNVTLNGSASSDPDGDNITYRWTDSAGTQIGTSANLTKYINVGSHQFTLTVRDSGGLTGSKTITASATNSGTGDVNIVSNFSGNNAGGWSLGAGASNVVNSGGLRFVGHHSSTQTLSSKTLAKSRNLYMGRTIAAGNDLRGAELKFTVQRHNWNSPRRFLVTANGHEVYNSASYTGSGQHEFTATLGQQSALSGSGSIDLRIYAYEGFWYGHSTVKAFSLQGGTTGGTNHAPVARANNVSRSGAGNVTLNGSASSDPDGDNITYRWTNSAGAQIGTSANLTQNINVGSHQFTLTVRDSGGLTNSKTITATATNPSTGGGVNIVSNFSGSSNGGWGLGAGLSNYTISNGMGFKGNYPANAVSTINQSYNAKQYIKLAIPAGSDMRGAQIKFSVQRSTWHSPRRFRMTVNGHWISPTPQIVNGDLNQKHFTFTLGNHADYDQSGPGGEIGEIRLYAFEGRYGGKTVTLRAFSVKDDGGGGGGSNPGGPIISNFSGSSAGGWSLGSGFQQLAFNNGLRASGHHSSSQTRSTKALAKSRNLYVGRTIAAGNDLRGATLKFKVARFDWNAARRFVITANGQEIYNSGTFSQTGEHEFVATLGQHNVLNGSGAVDFRIYSYDGLWYGRSTLKAFSII